MHYNRIRNYNWIVFDQHVTKDYNLNRAPPPLFWLAWKMWVYEMISVRPAGRLPLRDKNFNIAIFSDTVSMIKIKLCMMVLLAEVYLFIQLSGTLTIFQGHSYVGQF